MVLYMGEGIKTDYISRMKKHLDSKLASLGTIYYYYPNSKSKPRPLYVWRKSKYLKRAISYQKRYSEGKQQNTEITFNTFLETPISYIPFKDENYDLEYCDMNYLISKVSPFLEYQRYQKKDEIMRFIIAKAEEHNIILVSKGKSMDSIVENILSQWFMANYIDNPNNIDPLIPYNARRNKHLILDFV